MRVIYINGNLGNQVFICAFKDYLVKKYPNEKFFRHIIKGCPPVRVESYFDLKLPPHNWLISLVATFVFYSDIVLRKVFKKGWPFVCYAGQIDEKKKFFRNYLQDKYFYEDRDSSWLRIKQPVSYPEGYAQFENSIKTTDAVTVHIRRGDYVKPGSAYTDLSSTDYYDKAIAQAKEWYPNCQLFVFSDDLEYAKTRIKGNNVTFVNCNNGANSYLDIQLMSLAKVNIMANSTFSYWAAYINHENKKVIYPKAWFNVGTGRKAPDIMLNDWLGL